MRDARKAPRAAALAGLLLAAVAVLPGPGQGGRGAAAQQQPSAEAARREAERLAAVTQPEETPEVLPPGEGREEVFYACTACHSTAVIRRSRLSRQQWDELMDWMTEKHGMNPLEGEERRVIVDYLARAFPSSAGGGAGRRAANPFLTD